VSCRVDVMEFGFYVTQVLTPRRILRAVTYCAIYENGVNELYPFTFDVYESVHHLINRYSFSY